MHPLVGSGYRITQKIAFLYMLSAAFKVIKSKKTKRETIWTVFLFAPDRRLAVRLSTFKTYKPSNDNNNNSSIRKTQNTF